MKYFIAILFFTSSPTFGQEYNFNIHTTSLEDNLKNETKLGSELLSPVGFHVSFTGEAQPIKFQRHQNVIPDLVVSYFFKAKDSSMSYILYEWDPNNFEKSDEKPKSPEFQKALIEKYKKIKEQISSQFGQPNVREDYSNLANFKQESFFEESSSWQPNDSTEIELSTVVSNYYEKRGNSYITPTYRIRLYIRKTSNQNRSIEIGDNELKTFDTIKNNFYTALKLRDFQLAREYLADTIKYNITDDQFYELIELIDLDKKTVLVFSGKQISLDGKIYSVIQYKYFDDNAAVPQFIVQFIFDDQNKIAGIKPMSRLY